MCTPNLLYSPPTDPHMMCVIVFVYESITNSYLDLDLGLKITALGKFPLGVTT